MKNEKFELAQRRCMPAVALLAAVLLAGSWGMADAQQRSADELLRILGLSGESINAEPSAAPETSSLNIAALLADSKPPEAVDDQGAAEPGGAVAAAADGAEDEEEAGEVEVDGNFLEAVRAAGELMSYTRQGPSVTLDEALRITLANQPVLELAAESLAQAEANAKAAAGIFDVTVGAEFGKKLVYRPLTDAEIKRQIAQKQALNTMADALGKVATGLERGDESVTINFTDANGKKKTQVIPLDIGSLNNNFGGLQVEGQTTPGPDPATIEFLQSIGVVPEDVFGGDGMSAEDLEAIQKEVLKAQAEAYRLGSDVVKQAAKDLEIKTTERFETMNYGFGASKLFRNGMVFRPGVDFQQSPDRGNTARMSLDFTVPLLKDRGARVERAFEESALIDWDATRLQHYHAFSEVLLSTVVAFWNVVGAQQNAELLANTERINESFLRLTSLQVREGEKTSGDLGQAVANFGSSRAVRIASEFRLLEARRSLALAMGLDGQKLLDAPFAYGGFPEPIDADEVDLIPLDAVVVLAAENRQDLAAARAIAKSRKVLSKAFQKNMGPNLDFNFGFDATSRNSGTRAEDYFGTLTDNKVGLGAFGMVSLTWPVQDNVAKSQFLSAHSVMRQAEIGAFDLERSIQTQAVLALEEIRNTKLQLDAFREALQSSEVALIAEQARLQEGEGTLLDTIQVQSQFTTIAGSAIFAQLSHAAAVSMFRFQTGTMISGGTGVPGDESRVDVEDLTRIPDPEELRSFAGVDSLTPSGIPVELLQQWKRAGWKLGVDGYEGSPKPLLMRGEGSPEPLLVRGTSERGLFGPEGPFSHSEPEVPQPSYSEGSGEFAGSSPEAAMAPSPVPAASAPDAGTEEPVVEVGPASAEASRRGRPEPLFKRIFGN